MNAEGIAKLTEIVRRHYETAEFSNAFLIMPKRNIEAFRRAPRPNWTPSAAGIVHQLMDIPIVADNGCEADWRLVDRRTGDVLVSYASHTDDDTGESPCQTKT